MQEETDTLADGRPPAGCLWTIGHSTRDWDAFAALLVAAGIACLVDVRRFAGSRRNPQYAPAAMAPALQAAGIGYRALPELGGRRAPQPDSRNGAWRVAAFRGYADHLASPEYVAGRTRLLQLAQSQRCAVMCAEAVWWRCHRRLIADDFTARGWQVWHLLAPGKTQAHPLHPAARLVDDVLRYPAPADDQPPLFRDGA
ncbi:DUF488 family protein [Cognatiluteimonas weifangensis]|uniref:DUF488 domain-containing protein n=1 Tax=Cognatiluteimonas weifangensis TaxID=2303539 RepID=A0A372DNC1_9GAMM|nr:DUF488 domain-containing protein [Luteimonas weifangensis]RFP61063.1 DUF488 domain-containing protein [Luteimonas weifangensis]